MQSSEGDHVRDRSTSSIQSTVYTMNPEAKYLSPRPSVRHKARNPMIKASENTRSSVARYSTLLTSRSLPTMFPAASSTAIPLKPTSIEQSQAGSSASLAVSKSSPLLAAFQKLRGTKSAGRSEQHEFTYGSEALSNITAKNPSMENVPRVQQDNKPTTNDGARLVVSNRSPLRHPTIPPSMETRSAPASSPAQAAAASSAALTQKDLPAEKTHLPIEGVPHRGGGGSPGALNLDWPRVPQSPYYTPLDRLHENNSFLVDTAPDDWNQSPSSVEVDEPDPLSNGQRSVHPLFRHQPKSSNDPPIPTYSTAPEASSDGFRALETSFLDEESDRQSHIQERSVSSLESVHDIFSPDLAASTVQTDAMSPCHLSQPISPLRSDFDEVLLDSRDDYNSQALLKNTISDLEKFHVQMPSVEGSSTSYCTPHRSSAGFEGYSLPEAAQSSMLTLRDLPSSTFQPSSGGSPFSQPGSKDLVHCWNDGSEHRVSMTALDELVEDLGYLGEMIV